MEDRKRFTFEHRGCTLTVTSTEADGKWTSQGQLRFPDDTYEQTLTFHDGAYWNSAEDAFEAAKKRALAEIERRLS